MQSREGGVLEKEKKRERKVREEESRRSEGASTFFATLLFETSSTSSVSFLRFENRSNQCLRFYVFLHGGVSKNINCCPSRERARARERERK